MPDELTHEQAAELLRTPKWVVSARGRDGVRLGQQAIPAGDKFSARELILASQDKRDGFRMNMWSSDKRALKLSIHHREFPSHAGLLRVDYCGPPHTNPPDHPPDLPECLVPYIGFSIAPNQPHIHYCVSGHKHMAWAMPLVDSDFPIKSIESDAQISEAIVAFGAAISLKTELKPVSDLFA